MKNKHGSMAKASRTFGVGIVLQELAHLVQLSIDDLEEGYYTIM